MSGSVLNTLKGSLPENRIQRVLRSLRFNSLIWNSIQEQTFLDQVVEAAKFAPELWAPAGLALIKIGFKNLTIRSKLQSPWIKQGWQQ